MFNFFQIIFIPILCVAFKRFHKSLMIYCVLRLFLNTFIPILSLKGLPLLRLSLVCDTFFIGYYFYSTFWKNRKSPWLDFPLKNSFRLQFLSLTISSLLVLSSGFVSNISLLWMNIFSSYLIVVVFFHEVKDSTDIEFLIKGFGYVFIIAAIYGLFEFFNGYQNPLIRYEQSLNPNLDTTEKLMWEYSATGRGGIGRIFSIFAHPIGAGTTAAIFGSLFLYINLGLDDFRKTINISKIECWIFFFSTMIVLLLSNSRGPLLLFAISCFALVKHKKTYFCLFVLFVLLYFSSGTIFDVFVKTFLSMFDSSIEDSMGGGSNLSMREEQFDAAFNIWLNQGVLFGRGLSSTSYWISQDVGILGAESVWISLLLNQGVFGAVAYIILMIKIAKLFKNRFRLVGTTWTIAFLVCKSVTSTPGLNISTWLMVMFILYKIQHLYICQNLGALCNQKRL